MSRRCLQRSSSHDVRVTSVHFLVKYLDSLLSLVYRVYRGSLTDFQEHSTRGLAKSNTSGIRRPTTAGMTACRLLPMLVIRSCSSNTTQNGKISRNTIAFTGSRHRLTRSSSPCAQNDRQRSFLDPSPSVPSPAVSDNPIFFYKFPQKPYLLALHPHTQNYFSICP